MESTTAIIRRTGVIDEAKRLRLDDPDLPFESKSRVRVTITLEDEDISEKEWLKLGSHAFADWNDPEEDIYTLDMGVTFDEHRYGSPRSISVGRPFVNQGQTKSMPQ